MHTIKKQTDTADIFEYKFNKLNQELENRIEIIRQKIEQLEKENKKLKDSTYFKGSGPFISMILGFIFGIGFPLLIIGLNIAEGIPLDNQLWFASLFAALPGLIWGLIYYRKYSKLNNEKMQALEKIKMNEYEIEQLSKELSSLPQKYNALKQTEYEKLDSHMLNEQQLRDSDNLTVSQSTEQMKECPRCAELIKFKATYCRYCQSDIA